MQKLINSDTLALRYKPVGIDGKLMSKSITFKNITSIASDEDIYQTAVMIRDLLAYSVDKIARRTETVYIED
ncbi:MAG: DUF1659 domain-containing protein [Oscillospiraceae bacterium]|nr:DUF1659 domain-containing protein [Oscillospiraceae bacterium]